MHRIDKFVIGDERRLESYMILPCLPVPSSGGHMRMGLGHADTMNSNGTHCTIC